MSVNSRLKATKIIGQRKAFYRQIANYANQNANYVHLQMNPVIKS